MRRRSSSYRLVIIVFTLFLIYLRRSNDRVNGHLRNIFNNNADQTEGFAACLVLKDDNDRISEWLAYHYLTLPLRHLIVAIDPTGSTSPDKILKLWNETDMEILLWNDVDYGHWIDEEMDAKHQHRARQKNLMAHCMRYHQNQGRRWVALVDSDEYITYNILSDNDPSPDRVFKYEIIEQYESKPYIATALERRQELQPYFQNDTTIYDYLTIHGNDEPFVSEPCHLMPRLMFSAVESTPAELQDSEVMQYGFDPKKFSSIRYYRHHAKGDFYGNAFGKVIIDLSRVEPKTITRFMGSIHNPLEICADPPLKPFELGPLRVHHYLGSWRQYSSRNDVRRSRERFDMFATSNEGRDYQLQMWLHKFVEKMGVERSRRLLQFAGVIQKGPKPIIDTDEYVRVDYNEDVYYEVAYK